MASIYIRVTFWELSSDHPLQIQNTIDRQHALLGWHLYNHPPAKNSHGIKNIVTDFVCEWPPLVFNTMDFSSFSSAAKTLPDK